MNRKQFYLKFHQIVKEGMTPLVSCCNCGYGTWYFEGEIDRVYKEFVAPCARCKSTKKLLMRDEDNGL